MCDKLPPFICVVICSLVGIPIELKQSRMTDCPPSSVGSKVSPKMNSVRGELFTVFVSYHDIVCSRMRCCTADGISIGCSLSNGKSGAIVLD